MSLNPLDDELLMLAGEDDEDTKTTSPPRRKRSSPPTSASPAKKRSRPVVKKPSKKKTKRDDSDDDDGDSSALSEVGSSDMSSQSEADEAMDIASSSDEEDCVQNLYPLEGKYKDAADMTKLLAMEEIDREAVLAERAAQIERAQQDRHLRNLLKSRNAADWANGNAPAGGSSTRRSARTKSMPKKNEETTKRGKLDELKKIREERSTRAAGSGSGKPDRGDDDGPKRRNKTDEDEEKTGFAEELYTAKKEQREIQVSDVNRARIGRTGLGKLCDYPGFEDAVRDCFVRVSMYNQDTKANVYRIGLIKGFVTGKPYSMLDGKRRTDQHVRVLHSTSEKSFPMEFMSDSPMTEAEFIRFKKQCEVDKVTLPSLSTVEKKALDIRTLDSHTLTPEEVDDMIKKRNKDKIDPVQTVLKRAKLRQSRDIAVSQGDEAQILRFDKELQDLEDTLGRPHTRVDSQMDRLSRLNQENRKKNIAELRKAELDEKRAARRAAEEAEKSGAMSNPFARVKTKARIVHNSVEVRGEGGDPNSQGTSGDTPSGTPKGVGLIGNGTQKGRRINGIDDVIASLDFGIDIEI
ncbi:RNA polymerase-associated protein rtf1 [Maublancomyces gigas]|uniref:RNA polymerase-associated protein rtf1 n=1 Tax=Discina gigas TaxID=1032678 RepID=A0ABR3GTT4_9PEZI